MSRLVFKAICVRRVVEHALRSTSHLPSIIGYDAKVEAVTGPGKPAVILSRDYGIYLMSNGRPRDIINEGTGLSYVAYAKGCDPHTDSQWRATSHALVGGDDFSRALPWLDEIKKMIDEGISEIVIEFDADEITLVGG